MFTVSVVLNGEITIVQKAQIDFLRFLRYNRGMGVARCICNTNAKSAITDGYSMKCEICVCGLNGSGKATLAGALAKA